MASRISPDDDTGATTSDDTILSIANPAAADSATTSSYIHHVYGDHDKLVNVPDPIKDDFPEIFTVSETKARRKGYYFSIIMWIQLSNTNSDEFLYCTIQGAYGKQSSAREKKVVDRGHSEPGIIRDDLDASGRVS